MLRYAIPCKPLQTRRPPHTSLPAWGLTADPQVFSRGLPFNRIEFFVEYPKRGNSHFRFDCFLNGTCKPQFLSPTKVMMRCCDYYECFIVSLSYTESEVLTHLYCALTVEKLALLIIWFLLLCWLKISLMDFYSER